MSVPSVIRNMLFGNSLSWRVLAKDSLTILVFWSVYFGTDPLFRVLDPTAWFIHPFLSVWFWCSLVMSVFVVAWRSVDSALPMWFAFSVSALLALFGFDDAGRVAGVLACLGLAVRVAVGSSDQLPSADRSGDPTFIVVLVFSNVGDAATWLDTLDLIKETANIPSGPAVRLRVLSQGSDRTQPDACFGPDALRDITERLSTAQYQIVGDSPDQGRIDIYRDDTLDFLQIRPPVGWSKHNLLRLGLKWHEALDSRGLQTILGGTGLKIHAADVRAFREDMEHGYAIQGLEYSSPSLASLIRG